MGQCLGWSKGYFGGSLTRTATFARSEDLQPVTSHRELLDVASTWLKKLGRDEIVRLSSWNRCLVWNRGLRRELLRRVPRTKRWWQL
jgi:hypothetical protein